MKTNYLVQNEGLEQIPAVPCFNDLLLYILSE
jgi:hypothetical protein